MIYYRQNRFQINAFDTHLVLIFFFRVAIQSPLLWALSFCQAAVRGYDTICLLPVLPVSFSQLPF